LYKTIEDGELLDADKACQLWTAAKARIFGDSVDWSQSPHMEYEWARIPHHFIPNYRFYNWPYSFAQMLVYALYESYKEGNPEFMNQFKKLLSAGSSMSPKDQIAMVGHDITDPKFWELGAKQANRFLDELKKLI
jgi:oligoendopeptidase F